MGTWAHYGVSRSLERNLSSAILELVLASKVDFHWLPVASNNGDLLEKKHYESHATGKLGDGGQVFGANRW